MRRKKGKKRFLPFFPSLLPLSIRSEQQQFNMNLCRKKGGNVHLQAAFFPNTIHLSKHLVVLYLLHNAAAFQAFFLSISFSTLELYATHVLLETINGSWQTRRISMCVTLLGERRSLFYCIMYSC